MSDIGNYGWLAGYMKDEDVFVIGSGPSLAGFDFTRLKGRRKVVVSHMQKLVPMESGDVMCFLDAQAKRGIFRDPGDNSTPEQVDGDFYDAPFRIVTSERGGLQARGSVAIIKAAPEFSANPDRGVFGPMSSGHFAISLAYVAGARMIYIMGFDCHTPQAGKANVYDTQKTKGYMPASKPGDVQTDRYLRMLVGFNEFKTCQNIINLSGDSKILCFPKMTPEQAGL